MLSMSNVGSVAAAASYYAEDNYYSQDENQAKSSWEGKGAESLALSGVVDTKTFEKILSGHIDNQQLGRIIGKDPDGSIQRDHRPGYDVTLSAPKSVSIVAEVGGQLDVREAHEAAVSKVLEYIENNFAGARVTKGGETVLEKTDNLLAARFHHTTSRDLDPQSHTHLVIANATKTQDGVWRSLSNEQLYKNQVLLGNIYDSELAANLRSSGYRIDSTQNGKWEISGISREQIEHFSQRSKAIDERLEKQGLSRDTATAEQRENAALRTRASKKDVDHDALRQEWKERAAAIGIDFAKIELDRQYNSQRQIEQPFVSQKADEAVRFAVAHLTERESVVTRNQVIQVALDHSIRDSVWAGVRIADVETSLNNFVADKTVVVAREHSITTAEAIQRERSMLNIMDSGRGAVEPMVSLAVANSAINQFETSKSAELGVSFKLTTGQEDAARAVLVGENQYVGLQGYAGAGKTTMLELVNFVAQESGFVVRGMASSAEAAITLQKESGIESVTTARFLLDEGRRALDDTKPQKVQVFGNVNLEGSDFRSVVVSVPRTPDAVSTRKELWVVDEASLAGQREVTTVFEMAQRANARVVLVGDKLQLNAVDAGKPFELLQRAGIPSAEMTEISRQQVHDLKMAVASAVGRDNAQAFNHLAERVVEVQDTSKLLDKVVSDILVKHQHDRSNTLLIVPLNKDRQEVNLRVRQGLQDLGQIGKESIQFDVLVPAGFTDAQKMSTAYYEVDSVVRFGRDYRSLGIKRDDYASVVSVNNSTGSILLEGSDGLRFNWDPQKQSKVEVFVKERREVAVGDEIRFTKNNRDIQVNNGTLGKVTAVSSAAIHVETKKGLVHLDADAMQHRHWDYAYAMTVYASQGKTVADANLLITSESGKAMGERSFYVGITRPRTDLTIYTDSKERAVELIHQAQGKTSALEAIKDDFGNAGSKSTTEGGKHGGHGGKDNSAEL